MPRGRLPTLIVPVTSKVLPSINVTVPSRSLLTQTTAESAAAAVCEKAAHKQRSKLTRPNIFIKTRQDSVRGGRMLAQMGDGFQSNQDVIAKTVPGTAGRHRAKTSPGVAA